MAPDRFTTQLLRLREQLFNRVPLVGGWIRRRAAASLVSEGSPQAIEILASALDRLPDAQVQQIITQTIEAVKDQGRIDAVCRAWTQTRSPGLKRLIKARGWIASGPPSVRLLCALLNHHKEVVNNGGATQVQPLLAACQDRDATIAETAQEYLECYTNQNAIDELCTQWVVLRISDNPLQHYLSQAITRAGYIATRPPQARVLSALKNSRPDLLRQDDEKIVPELVKALDDREKLIAAQAAVAITGLANPAAMQAAARVVLSIDHPILQQAVLKGGYLPDEPIQRALFFFLTGQWKRYEDLDYDHSLLRTLYESAGSALRERLKLRLRQAGRSEYLGILTGRDEDSRFSEMSPSELDLLIQMLAEQHQWERLWSLVIKIPLAWSLRVVQLLGTARNQKTAWQPGPEAELALFNQLLPLATPQALEVSITPGQYIPPALERSRVRLVHGRLNDVEFHPSLPRIAICTSSRRVVEWDIRGGVTERTVAADSSGKLFEHSLGEVAYTRHGTLVFAERTRGDDHCRVYASRDGVTNAIFTETGSITSLEPASEAGILLTGRSQFATLLDLDGPAALVKRQVYTFWPRAACVHPQKQLVALVHHGVELVSLPDLTSIGRSPTWNNIIHCAAFIPDSEDLAIGRLTGEVRLLARRGRQIKHSGKSPVVQHKGWVVGVQPVQRYDLLVTAGAEGLVNFIYLPGQARQIQASQVGKAGEQITALHISAGGDFIALTHSDSMLSLWDLRVQELPKLMKQPFISATPNQLPAAAVLANEESLPAGVRQAAQAVLLILQHRFRFDIEIEAVAEVKAGEFDIEIE